MDTDNMEDLDIKGVASLHSALGRTPNGQEAVRLAERMGLWSSRAHNSRIERLPFPTSISEMGPSQLSDLSALWTSEFGRITEILGAIKAQEAQLKIQARAVRARARADIHRGYAQKVIDGELTKIPTTSIMNDEAEEDPGVLEVDKRMALIELLREHAVAAKEGTQQYINSISREITYRGDQMKARMYG